MLLAGRLQLTTLGDVLGALYRGRATGILELTEASGRIHRIHLAHGLVREIESSHAERSTVSTRLPLDAPAELRRERRAKLEVLFRITDARLAFRVADCRRAYRAVWPLAPQEFLHGRPRYRDRSRSRTSGPSEDAVRGRDPVRARALRTLGLPENADATAVSQAFRTLAARVHPDRFPEADETRRAELLRRFAELSAAYHLLVA